jgi:hypothetical protein
MFEFNFLFLIFDIRAEDWDLANPLFTGCLRVYQADTKVRSAAWLVV